jgi:hypothetical protein
MRIQKIITAVVCLVVIACQPEPDPNRLYDELVVSTNFDPQANFANYATYAISTDTIGLISNNSADTIIVAAESSFPRPVLEAVQTNLDKAAFARVGRDENPDLGVSVMVVNDLNVFQELVYYDPYYYSGGYYSGYYGYGSAYYYPYINTYAYNTAVLVIELVDLKNRNSSNQVRVIWNAYLGDLTTSVELVSQTEVAIDQAFKQSPYLKGP